MAKPTAYVIYGLGIGCHKEVAHAYEIAGAKAELVHFRKFLEGGRDFLFRSQILNPAGGFLHGDILGAGMCAANELEQSGIKDLLIEYAQKGNVIYGQCNGFQLLVKTGLLPGIDGDYSNQTTTLTHNDCGNYRVAFIDHRSTDKYHFMFDGLSGEQLYIWCRHGEGKLKFWSEYGLISKEDGENNRRRVNQSHVLLRYVKPAEIQSENFLYNPNGSVDDIAGMVDPTGNIIGHMAHTEVGIYCTRDPRWFFGKDQLRRQGIKAEDLNREKLEDVCLQVFKNIVNHVR